MGDGRRASVGAIPEEERIGIRNNYRLIRTLESGTTSDVWVAAEKGTGTQVAVKVLRVDGDADETAARKARWESKIRTALFFSNEHHGKGEADISSWVSPQDRFLRLLKYSQNTEGRPGPETDGKWYAAYEWAEATLVERIDFHRDCGSFMGLAQIRTISKALAEILAWLQSCGLCHLHLRPESLMFSRGNWKLKDAELAKPSGPARLEPGLFDASHASPELANVFVTQSRSGEPGRTIMLNRAADAYAAGLILLECAANRDPFHGIRDPEWGDDEWLQYLAASPPEASQLLPPPRGPAADPGLRAFLTGLLQPQHIRRLTTDRMLMHPFILAVGSEKAAMPMDAGVTSATETTRISHYRPRPLLRHAMGRLPTLPFEVPALPHYDGAFRNDFSAALNITSDLAAPKTTAASAVVKGNVTLTDFAYTRVSDRLPEPPPLLAPRSPRPRVLDTMHLSSASGGARLSASLPTLPCLVSKVENVLRPLTPMDNPAQKIKYWRAHKEADSEMLVRRAKRNVRLYADKLLKEQAKKAAQDAKLKSKGPQAPRGSISEEGKDKKQASKEKGSPEKAKAKAKPKAK